MATSRRYLEGKVAIITGGGRGIGVAAALSFAAAGAAVTVAARTLEEIETVSQRIRQVDGDALAVPTDVADYDQVREMVDRTLDAFGRVDFLVNLAGVVHPMGQLTWEVDPGAWREAIEANLMGAFQTSHAVLPYMVQQGSGRVLNISSTAAEVPIRRSSAYCAAKAGVNHLTRVLALELRGTGVTANSFNPGPADTPTLRTVRSLLFPDLPGRVFNTLLRSPAESAYMILWLCSPATAQLSGRFISWNDPSTQSQIARFVRYHGLSRWSDATLDELMTPSRRPISQNE